MRRGRILGLGICGAVMMAGAATMLPAQTNSVADQQTRLSTAKQEAKQARSRSAQLEKAAKAERNEAAKAQAETAAVNARIQATQADIVAARARIAIVRNRLTVQQQRLAREQGPIARLVAALQSMARRPEILSIVQPGSTDDMVHVRAMLGTMLPVIRQRTAQVRGEIDHTRALREQARQAAAGLIDSRRTLEKERMALLDLEAQHRLKSRDLNRNALFESDRAIALGEQARDIVEKMEEMHQDSTTRATLATLPGPLPRPSSGDADTSPSAGKPPYILPVHGRLVTGLGELSDNGVRSRGLHFVTWPGAKVVAPAAGRVRFAGPFKSYGTIVIIDHGDDWSTLVTGLASTTVAKGDTVAQGAPIGNAPSGNDPTIGVELRRRGEPIDITGLLGG
ncbi:peptidoglycan DD-metalloendopeptidase family protein [Stakelama sediminis]|uniref:Septal ring factor EnvC (AmiA/AmiB activator) n=1 Tax=Stakelama sediminis TaxID=463200 RepID=A0A840YWH0_9SPHN|nr:peptidoglycan DD-metalloendopeptidase family protein [Stakelama sediminis]MBB5717983.1 septal ring factor EnvC (AmiA/AmiB activator) [Stakelama sediminis]